MKGRHYFLITVLVCVFQMEASGQDSIAASNQKRIEDLRARVSRLSNESTDSLILMLRQAVRQQRDSLTALARVVDHYEGAARQFSYSAACDCNRIYYGLDRYEANYPAYPELDSIALLLRNTSSLRLKLVGHADNSGTARINEALALKRAENLKTYLMKRYELSSDRIITEGRGSADNIRGIKDPYLHHLNRRVEIWLE